MREANDRGYECVLVEDSVAMQQCSNAAPREFAIPRMPPPVTSPSLRRKIQTRRKFITNVFLCIFPSVASKTSSSTAITSSSTALVGACGWKHVLFDKCGISLICCAHEANLKLS